MSYFYDNEKREFKYGKMWTVEDYKAFGRNEYRIELRTKLGLDKLKGKL